jgi:hypothetical protein
LLAVVAGAVVVELDAAPDAELEAPDAEPPVEDGAAVLDCPVPALVAEQADTTATTITTPPRRATARRIGLPKCSVMRISSEFDVVFTM